MDGERKYRVKWGNRISEPPLEIPRIGFAAEVIKFPEYPQTQAHSILPGEPFWAESTAKLWVERRFLYQERLGVDVTRLTGFVRCGQVIATFQNVLAVNTDSPMNSWMYALTDAGDLVWSELVVETGG